MNPIGIAVLVVVIVALVAGVGSSREERRTVESKKYETRCYKTSRRG